ncbi:hypothetical protein, partial [Massilia sp. Root1485]|uniref:hypothetical protein n=1 Tax=Massilia sp. Root1485 TaxID=1736472 RepID=UPI0006F7B197
QKKRPELFIKRVYDQTGLDSYAPFQTHQFANRIRREHATQLFEIDLNKPFYEYQDEPPF